MTKEEIEEAVENAKEIIKTHSNPTVIALSTMFLNGWNLREQYEKASREN